MTVTAQPPEREPSSFERVADYVSAAMGRPVNIAVWLVLVIAWTALFASGLVNPAGTFLPGWFTSQGFNFPLNLVTTVAELFIGFLVAAASNRSERNLNRTLAAIAAQETRVGEVEDGLRADLAANTDLTRKVHDLTRQQMTLLAGIEHANAELNVIRQAVAPAAPSPVPDAPVSRETAERLHNPGTDGGGP